MEPIIPLGDNEYDFIENTMNLTAIASLLVVSLAWCGSCSVSADTLKLAQPKQSFEYNQMVERINAARASKDIAKMESLAEKIQTNWSEASIDQYSTLMDKICSAILFSSMSHENQIFPVVNKYALLALKRKGDMPVLIEADFVSYLLPQEGKLFTRRTLKGKDWVEYRSVRTAIALHALGRVEKETDQNFDFSRTPLLQVSPPLAAGVDSGTSPENVADPKLRAEYEASIKANDAINDKYNEQHELKSLQNTFVPQEENYIVCLYSIQPYNQPELKHLLDTYLSDSVAKQRIIDQVAKNTATGKSGS